MSCADGELSLPSLLPIVVTAAGGLRDPHPLWTRLSSQGLWWVLPLVLAWKQMLPLLQGVVVQD